MASKSKSYLRRKLKELIDEPKVPERIRFNAIERLMELEALTVNGVKPNRNVHRAVMVEEPKISKERVDKILKRLEDEEE